MRPFRRLPPLNALRSYEAAARHLSFTRAAGELGVTPAAVSHQVKMLEDHLGVALFQRVNRQLVLTEAGGACLPGIRAAFEGLSTAIDSISVAGRSGVLTVSVAPSFASKWLLPRLERFKAIHPDIDVRVSASMQLVDFAGGEIDVAIRYGSGRYPGLASERLIDEAVIPVCSPKLLEGPNAPRTPADVRAHTLLHDDSPDDDASCPTWEMWLRAAGIEGDRRHARAALQPVEPGAGGRRSGPGHRAREVDDRGRRSGRRARGRAVRDDAAALARLLRRLSRIEEPDAQGRRVRALAPGGGRPAGGGEGAAPPARRARQPQSATGTTAPLKSGQEFFRPAAARRATA